MEELLWTVYTLYGAGGVLALAAGFLIYRRLPQPWKQRIKAALPKLVERIKTR